MDALTVLHQRVSAARLQAQEPDETSLRNIYQAALRAADHALLRPWRFLVIRGQSRERLGELFARATLDNDPKAGESQLQKAHNKALRAPVIVVAINSPRQHPKVPRFEQELSTGAAVQNMLNAAFAQELGAMWRTGNMVFAPAVREGLGLNEEEKIVGFLYLGYRQGALRQPPQLHMDDYFQEW